MHSRGNRNAGNAGRILVVGVLLAAAAGLPGCKRTAPSVAQPSATAPVPATTDGSIRVLVDASGYNPASIRAPLGKPVTLTFRRVSDVGCGDEVVFPKQNIRKPLPLNQDVTITITPAGAGEIAFTCGMGMYKGALVIAPS